MNIDKDFCKQMQLNIFADLVRKIRIEKTLKAIHYVILLMSSEDKDDTTKNVDSFNLINNNDITCFKISSG